MASVAAVSNEFDHAMAYSLSWLGKSELKLKPEQKASMKHVYEYKDVFMRLPTGFTKSICYEALHMLRSSVICSAVSVLWMLMWFPGQ